MTQNITITPGKEVGIALNRRSNVLKALRREAAFKGTGANVTGVPEPQVGWPQVRLKGAKAGPAGGFRSKASHRGTEGRDMLIYIPALSTVPEK